jgi:hypothetical protein
MRFGFLWGGLGGGYLNAWDDRLLLNKWLAVMDHFGSMDFLHSATFLSGETLTTKGLRHALRLVGESAVPWMSARISDS